MSSIQTCSLNVAEWLQPNIRKTFDLAVYDHELFRLHTKALRIEDPYGVFKEKTYIIAIGGNEIHRGTFANANNLFPYANIPLGLLSLHKVEIVILDVSIIPASTATFNLIHETFEFAGTLNWFEMPWPSDDDEFHVQSFRIMGGIGGLSYMHGYLRMDDDYIARNKQAMKILQNGERMEGVSHLNEHNEYHADAHDNVFPDSASKLISLLFRSPSYSTPSVQYETLKLPMKVSGVFATCELKHGVDAFANFEILTNEQVVGARLTTSGAIENPFDCLTLTSAPTGVKLDDFSNYTVFNLLCGGSNISHGRTTMHVAFAAPVRGDVWLKLDRLVFAPDLRRRVYESNLGRQLDISIFGQPESVRQVRSRAVTRPNCCIIL